MRQDATWTESRDFHLAGLLLVSTAAVLGIVLSLTVLVLERDERAAVANLAAGAEAASAQAAASVPSAAVSVLAPAQPAAAPAQGASVPVTAPSVAGDATAGKAAFAATCNACHPNGKAGVGPDLTGLSGETVQGVVRQGRGMMPAYAAAQLSDQQLGDIIAFLRSAQ